MTIQAKSTLAQVKPYAQGRGEIEGIAEPIKLSANELPYPPSPLALAAFHDAATNIGRYPDGAQKALRRAIAAHYNILEKNIFAGNGSEEAIGLVVRSIISPGENMVVSENSFIMTEICAKSCGAEVLKAPEKNHCVDVDALLALVNEKTRIVYVCSPNNPTGTYLPISEMERLETELPEGVLLILDAACSEFVTATDYDCGIRTLFKPSGRVVVTHTFSKAYGLAGQRIGWAAAPDNVIDAVSRLRTPFNTNSPALAAAEAAIIDQEYLLQTTQKIVTTRAWFIAELEGMEFKTVPSQANFVLLIFDGDGGDAALLDAALLTKGIIGRPVSNGANEFRISIGSDAEMQQTADAIRAWQRPN